MFGGDIHQTYSQLDLLSTFFPCNSNPALPQLIEGAPPNEHISLVKKIFSSQREIESACNLPQDNAQTLINIISDPRVSSCTPPPLTPEKPVSTQILTSVQVLDHLARKIRKSCSSTLSEICGSHGLLPQLLPLLPHLNLTENPLHPGRSADMWKSQYQGKEVGVKVLRVSQRDILMQMKTVG